MVLILFCRHRSVQAFLVIELNLSMHGFISNVLLLTRTHLFPVFAFLSYLYLSGKNLIGGLAQTVDCNKYQNIVAFLPSRIDSESNLDRKNHNKAEV